MSLTLQAPVPAIKTTTILPNPRLGDTESRKHSIDIFRAIDGTLRTSVKSNNRHVFTYSFSVSRAKSLEIKAFVSEYYASKIRVINHKGQVWEGYFANNPIELTHAGKDGASEYVEVQLQFNAERIV